VTAPRFEVETMEPLRLQGSPELLACELMSPFAWRDRDEALHLLVRAVPPLDAHDPVTGRIWYGRGEPDGLTFRMDDHPAIEPGPGPLDCGGCEDPTWVPSEDECLVYYTGLDVHGDGQLLYARGPSPRELRKCGVALASSKTERNTKEAAVDQAGDGRWRLFYEYSQDWRSKVGLAFGQGPHGPWDEQPEPFAPREGRWDCWHLSTGPLVMTDRRRPVMFYNGSDRAPKWGVGWVIFDADLATVVARSDDPLILPPEQSWHGRDICFVASAVPIDARLIWLFGSRNDRKLFRATVRRNY
jgi:predicted GH43/DUF377 family glycosyl hydrolase